jgi:hypothetical protein
MMFELKPKFGMMIAQNTFDKSGDVAPLNGINIGYTMYSIAITGHK